ncbi:MAG: hypothetical protein AW10_01293 [Candidatus Accumulibacter appositus]|uniref:Uncharacterized protein n=1 Tax=Candidatus Accumulibacter appositus TaxID=1454003 RepID=A0A011QQV3_9PROT|nr:MAG: hypothetical protein AW10_01293 [Candidatus Accumulibacter appositus]
MNTAGSGVHTAFLFFLHEPSLGSRWTSPDEAGDGGLFFWVSPAHRFLECYLESLCLS